MISVSGSGRAAGQPDVVRLRITASALRPTAAEALAAAEATVTAVRAALAAHGITGADAASGTFAMFPEQVWNEQHGPRITGHRCDHEIRVRVRDLSALGRVIGDALAAGGDGVRMDGFEPAVEDPAPLRARARELAWADALDRARRLAALAGRELGPVEEIVESGPGPAPFAKAEAMALAARDVSVQPGELDVGVVLHVRWALR